MSKNTETIDCIDINSIKLNKAAFLLDQLRTKYYGMYIEDATGNALSVLSEPVTYNKLDKQKMALVDTMVDYKGIAMTLEIISEYLDDAVASLDAFSQSHSVVLPKE